MKVAVDINNSRAEEKMNIAFDNILNQIADISVKDTTDFVEETYNNKFKKDFETARLINDSPEQGESESIKIKIDIKLKKQVYNKAGEIELEVKDPNDLLVIRAQDLGTGLGVNEKILKKFGVKDTSEGELSKYYMNPKYHLSNFKKFLENIKQEI